MNYPGAVATDLSGNVYIADAFNNRIRKINTATGIIITIAGTGAPGFSGDGAAATLARLNDPGGITVDAAGNVFIADVANNCIRKVNTAGVISTVAGMGGTVHGYTGDGGPATLATLYNPSGVAVDGDI